MTSKETIEELERLLKVEKDRVHKDMVFITSLEMVARGFGCDKK